MEIILLIFLLTSLLKKPSSNLYCGIFAWTGDSNKKFNWDKFNILGIYNDNRGGDSCGRVSGDYKEYGLGKDADYHHFITKTQNFPVRERMMIGHDRKASPGYAINLDNAQPIVLEEDGEVTFVMAHNGTILNIDDLKKKYNIEAPFGKSDSYILAKIIYDYGFNVLTEYRGAAALIIYDRRKFLETGDTYLYVFKGASKFVQNSVNISEERPLFLGKNNNSVYISSISESLFAIGIKEVIDIDENELICFRNGILYEDECQIIDRDKAGQYKDTIFYGGSQYKSKNLYNDYDDYGYYEHYALPAKPSYVDLEAEWESRVMNQLTYSKSLYHINNKLANGVIFLSNEGKLRESKIEGESEPFYFIHGVMIDGHDEYNKTVRWINNTTVKPGSDEFKRLILANSKYPLLINNGSPNGAVMTHMMGNTRIIYNGEIKPMFGEYKYKIERGLCTDRSYIIPSERIYPKFTTKKREDLDMIEQESARIMGEVLESITSARESLAVLGDVDVTKTLIKNLNEIEDQIFLNKDGNLCKMNLKLNVEWQNRF